MRRFLGIDLGGSSIKWCSVNEESDTPSEVESRATPADADGVRAALREIIRRAQDDADLAAVCVGTPGLVDETGAILGDAVNLPGWGNESLAQSIGGDAGVAVSVKNDASLATLAETRIGAARGRQHVVGIFIGTGIGGGLCINGQLYEGAGGLAGEIGHTVVESNGAPCPCGQRGCLERYSAAIGIVRLCLQLSSGYDSPLAYTAKREAEALTAEAVYRAFADQDPLAHSVHAIACEKLAQAIGSLMNTLSPELVVLGGGVMRSGPAIIETVRSYLPRYSLEQIRRRTDIAPASLGVHAGAIGGALFARESHPLNAGREVKP